MVSGDEDNDMPDIAAAREKLFAEACGLFERLRSGALREDDLVELAPAAAPIGVDAIDHLIRAGQPIEPDLAAFRRLDDPNAVIIDCGANFGGTAITLRALTRCWLYALEPGLQWQPLLAHLARRDPKLDFAPLAAGAENADLPAYVPVLDGTPIESLATVGGATLEPWLAHYLSTLVGVEAWLPVRDAYRVQLARHSFPVRQLDHITSAPDWRHRGRRVTGLKLDVEGYEFEVVSGAGRLLAEHQPLLMIEVHPPKHARMTEILAPIGYVPARRLDDQLRLMDGGEPHYNAYFLHRAQMADYRQRGLLID